MLATVSKYFVLIFQHIFTVGSFAIRPMVMIPAFVV